VKTKLSEYLMDKRVKADLTQKDVAKKMKFTTPQFISNWERGLSSPPVSSIKKLAKIYSIPATELFEVVLEVSLKQTEDSLRTRFNKIRK
jgi:transcriptional regulator with XRE-family HTH domain